MNSLKLLLLGDVHFPDSKSALTASDYKDKAFPSAVAELSVPNKLENVAREVARLRDSDQSIVGILLCGDLTSKGDFEGYKECIKYLNSALLLDNHGQWSPDAVHVVPGNHDIDRANSATLRDCFEKFIPLSQAWDGYSRRSLTTNKVRHSRLGNELGGLDIFSLNSCIGCGERRMLPDAVRKALGDLLHEAVVGPDKDFDLAFEQLDTPAFQENDMTLIAQAISGLSPTRLPIVLAHHNILPQAAPRIDLYTEPINAGLVRSRLLGCSHPVLYCHGHIHSEPVELISASQSSCGPVVSISVPQLIQGFDVLEVHFGTRHLPMGCTIHRYRVQNDGGVASIAEKACRISLCSGQYQQFASERLTKIIRHLKYPDFLRVANIMKPLRRALGKSLTSKLIKDHLLESEWLGLARILNRDDTLEQWQVQKLQP